MAVRSVVAAVFATAGILCSTDASRAADITVVAGDTIKVAGRPIRLWGIKAPVLGERCVWEGEDGPCASMSKRVLELFVGREELRCLVRGNDGAGQVVAQCLVAGADLGHLMVLSGWAVHDPEEGAESYGLQEEAARAQQVGMWKIRPPAQ